MLYSALLCIFISIKYKCHEDGLVLNSKYIKQLLLLSVRSNVIRNLFNIKTSVFDVNDALLTLTSEALNMTLFEVVLQMNGQFYMGIFSIFVTSHIWAIV